MGTSVIGFNDRHNTPPEQTPGPSPTRQSLMTRAPKLRCGSYDRKTARSELRVLRKDSMRDELERAEYRVRRRPSAGPSRARALVRHSAPRERRRRTAASPTPSDGQDGEGEPALRAADLAFLDCVAEWVVRSAC